MLAHILKKATFFNLIEILQNLIHIQRSLLPSPTRELDIDVVVPPESWTHSPNEPFQADDVPCDICRGNKSTSVKSCLVCQTSYCELHLAAHLMDPALQRHRLTDPATFPASRLCRNHNKPLTMFCKRDQMPVCEKCAERDHKHHETSPMGKESKRVKVRKSLCFCILYFFKRENELSALAFLCIFLAHCIQIFYIF